LKNHDKSKAIVIGDLGCGGGDMLKLMARWLQKKGYKSKLIGIDANDFMIDFAKKELRTFLIFRIYMKTFLLKVFNNILLIL
jgi:ubiquinone/menaquinone biosynthesis C-methylase UbiE